MKSIYVKISFVCIIILVIITFSSGSTLAQTKNYKAYSLFIYNFMKYTNWPEGDGGSLKVGIMGDSKIFEHLSESTKDKNINGRAIEVLVIDKTTTLEDMDLVFIPFGKSSSTSNIVENTAQKPIIVVTEREDQIKKGACIAFTISNDGRLSFILNDQELADRNIKIANTLRSLATKI